MNNRDVSSLKRAVEALLIDNARLRQTLSFYADLENYVDNTIESDEGVLAREILEDDQA